MSIVSAKPNITEKDERILYRRADAAGGTYFFAVIVAERRSDLLVRHIDDLRAAMKMVWEHQILDEINLARRVDYIHYNSVKHGWVTRPVGWPHSTLHGYIERGMAALD